MMGTKSAGCGCENVVFVSFCWSRSESGAPCFRGVHSSNKHYVAVYCLISMRFSAFFQKGLLFQTHYLILIFVTGWRHNFRKIALKKCEKSKNRRKRLCAPLVALQVTSSNFCNNSITEVAKRWPTQPFISHQSIISDDAALVSK